MKQKLRTKKKKNNSTFYIPHSKLVWVYPPNNWQSSSNKTFIYGYSQPQARLFVSTDDYLTPQRVNIFPNGNFAKVINLPNVENAVRLIQITNKKTNIIKRKIYIKPVGANQCVRPPNKFLDHYRHLGRHTGLPLRKKTRDVVIVIDPGHGGKEHGTHSPKGIPEKVFNLQISKLLSNGLKKYCRNVYLTRTKDKFISLQDRINFARKKKCNIFISIHHNALPDNQDPLKHCGLGIYYTHNYVKPLAKKLLFNISKESGLKRYGVFKRDFFVTRPRFYKGVLVECGFLTHPIEAEYVTQREIQEKIVRGIVKGILSI